MRRLATLMLVIAAASCLYASWSTTWTIDDGSSFTFQVNDLQHEAAGMRGEPECLTLTSPSDEAQASELRCR